MALEFTATVKPGGSVGTDCDYTTMQSAETGLQNDLTAATTKVFTISASSATRIAAGSTLLGGTSGATGVCVLVDFAKSQIWIKTIAVAAFQSGETVTGSDTNTCVLSSAGDSPIAGIKCLGGQDTTACTVNGWTTGASNYIRIYAAAAAVAKMPYDTSTAYRLEVSNICLVINEEYVRVERLQFKSTSPAFAQLQYCIHLSVSSATGSQRITGCYIRGVMHASNTTQVVGIQTSNNETARIENCFIEGYTNTGNTTNTAFKRSSANSVAISNCTLINCAGGFIGLSSAITIKNCLYDGGSSGNQLGFSGTPNTNSDYNATNDATAYGTHSRASQTFTYVNAGSSDWHLSPSDTAARDFGTDLSGTFTDDFDGNTRSGSWDIGASESAGSTYDKSVSEGGVLGDTMSIGSIDGAPQVEGGLLGDSFSYSYSPGGSGAGSDKFWNYRKRRD